MANDEKPLRDERGRLLPGHGGLPGAGRPKGSRSLNDDLRRILQEDPEVSVIEKLCEAYDLGDDVRAQLELCGDKLEAIALLTAHRALHGSLDAFKEIFDRLEPKARRNELSGPGGGPIPVAGAVANLSDNEAEARYHALVAGPAGAGVDDEE